VSQGEEKQMLSTNRSKPLTPTRKNSAAPQRLKEEDSVTPNIQGGSKFKGGIMSKLAKKDDTVDIT